MTHDGSPRPRLSWLGAVRANIRFARARFDEGGVGLVVRRGIHKAIRLSKPAASREESQQAAPTVTADEIAQSFDPDWYTRFYGLSRTQIPAGALEHYLRMGQRNNLSMSASTHETNASPDCPLHGTIAGLVREDFDPEWYLRTYPEVGVLCLRGTIVSPLWHYLTTGARAGLSPNPWFDEQWYLRTYLDVALSKELGGVPFGFVHYQSHGRSESRSPSVEATPAVGTLEELTDPVGLEGLRLIESVLAPFPHRVYPATGTPRINFLVPTLDKHLMFGGYIAAMNFINQLLDRGWKMRILVVNDLNATSERLTVQFVDDPLVMSILNRTEVVTVSRRSEMLDISTDDRFIAYSMWTAYHADMLAQAVGRRFLFFIQEFEPTFHHHDSWHALGAAMYAKPHFALFNSAMLRAYFRAERLGVFRDGEQAGLQNSAVFEHALSVPAPPTVEQLARGDKRRLLFYGRPEAHASRNLFELGVAGLRHAMSQGVFEGEWTFDAVGSLSTEAAIPVGRGQSLNLRPRLPLGDYVSALRGVDVGLSLQYAPHPGVVHFEMAACGVATVTNAFRNRSAADLRAISANLVGVEPTVEGIADGLAEAAACSRDVEARAKAAADGHWVSSWSDSFNDTVMATVEAELR